MKINGIVCINGVNQAIGYNNSLLFRLKQDMAFFKQTTTHTHDSNKQNAVLMGYNTYTSIPTKHFPLHNRINIVITKNHYTELKKYIRNHSISNVFVYRKILNAIHFCSTRTDTPIESLFIIGGSSIYNYCISKGLYNDIYVTSIFSPKLDIGDTFLHIQDTLALHYVNQHTKICTEKNVVNLVDQQTYDVQYSISKYKNIHEIPYTDILSIKTNEHTYLKQLRYVLDNGETRQTRNSETISTFGIRMEFDLTLGFPLLTTKKMFWKGIKEELMWFLQANTNAKDLSDKGVRIWDGNSTKEYLDSIGLDNYNEGDCGPIYGFQWRHFNARYRGCNVDYTNQGVDQLRQVIHLLRTNPTSRRIFMSAWNPEQMQQMALPPCHISYQFYVSEGNMLQCQMYQRSGDMFLGIPFNIASTALLVHIIAKMTDLTPGKIILVVGDAHIYKNHLTQVQLQLERIPYIPPTLIIKTKQQNIEDYDASDCILQDYCCYPSIKANMVT